MLISCGSWTTTFSSSDFRELTVKITTTPVILTTINVLDPTTRYFYFQFLTYFSYFSWPTGSLRTIKDISIREMLPDIKYYMTYEGSTTHPGCWETTVWIVLNKPIYITRREVNVYTYCIFIFYYEHTW